MRTDRPRWSRAVGRAIDVFGALVGLIVAAPVLIVLAVHSAISLRAWPVFVQTRVGLHSQNFRVWKIRTLPPETPRYADKYELAQRAIPAFARRLRNSHLDELPQLALVLIGKMSLVGPRPEMEALYDGMREDHRTARISVRPGCTGLWQLSRAASGLISESPAYDHFYLANHTIRLDVWILLQTLRTMVFDRALDLTDVPGWVLPHRKQRFAATAIAPDFTAVD